MWLAIFMLAFLALVNAQNPCLNGKCANEYHCTNGNCYSGCYDTCSDCPYELGYCQSPQYKACMQAHCAYSCGYCSM